jgi:cysteinyl-tRNA synthetase
MVLQLSNSLQGEVTRFAPASNRVTAYVCGITPYATTHLGHLFTYATADIACIFHINAWPAYGQLSALPHHHE